MCRDKSCIRECKQRVQVEVRVYRISQVCNPPAPVRHRSPTRSQPVRGHRHSRTSVYRWSRIGRVARPHQYACNDRGGRNPEVRQTACAVAPSLSATLPQRAPARSSNADPVHRWSKIGRVARPHQYACNDRGGRNPKVRQTPSPSCHRSRLLLQTVRRPAQARLTPFIDGRKSVPSRTHFNMRSCKHRGGRNP